MYLRDDPAHCSLQMRLGAQGVSGLGLMFCPPPGAASPYSFRLRGSRLGVMRLYGSRFFVHGIGSLGVLSGVFAVRACCFRVQP